LRGNQKSFVHPQLQADAMSVDQLARQLVTHAGLRAPVDLATPQPLRLSPLDFLEPGPIRKKNFDRRRRTSGNPTLS
jgi:hypothetical protein